MKVCRACAARFDDSGWKCAECGYEPVEIDGFVAHAPEYAEQSGGFEPEFFKVLSEIEEKSFWFRARNKLIVSLADKYFKDADSFLELGCGTGFVLREIAKSCDFTRVYGSDIFVEGLRFARERVAGSAELFQADATDLPFEDEFDLIGVFDLIEHIEDDRAVLQSIYRSLKPGGGVIITVPQHPFLWSTVDEYTHHVRRYTKRNLHDIVAGSGFEILRSTSFVTSLFPVMLISRLRDRNRKSQFDSRAEHDINSTLSSLFEKMLSAEIRLVESGVSLPFGGSLVVAARKPG
ncbi:MAG TPA: methyltransferase domain-containing protein [bacterium]|mgnify:CR=1 FL=1|nr:methyltransferase domain-containing protein [bacterium]